MKFKANQSFSHQYHQTPIFFSEIRSTPKQKQKLKSKNNTKT